MSFFWSSWITVFSLGCWLFIFGVLVWTLRNKPKLEEDGTTGHEYDGIREYDKPLPKWWLAVFFATMFWGLGYFVFFPAVQPNEYKGLLTVEVDGKTVPWTSENELNSALEKNNATFVQNFEAVLQNAGAGEAIPVLANLNSLQAQVRAEKEPSADLQAKVDEQIKALAPFVDKIAADPEVQKMGSSLFLQNCALCHGSNAKGGIGYPDLTDNDWIYGGEASDILTTIHKGRIGGMPAWRSQIGESGVKAAAEYVMSISAAHKDMTLDSTLTTQGKAIFEQNCVVCHGKEGVGIVGVAPNLTDDVWLFGADPEAVRDSIRHGRSGVMPAWQVRLGNERVMLLSAYVKSLSQTQQ